MSKKIKYTDKPVKFEAIDNFLPPPEQLVMKDDTVKVTLQLTRRSVEFFKQLAQQNHTKYQKLIRGLVDEYAHHFIKG